MSFYKIMIIGLLFFTSFSVSAMQRWELDAQTDRNAFARCELLLEEGIFGYDGSDGIGKSNWQDKSFQPLGCQVWHLRKVHKDLVAKAVQAAVTAALAKERSAQPAKGNLP